MRKGIPPGYAISQILTHLAYRANVKKSVINNSQLKCLIADVICYWSVRRCNVVLRLKKVTNTCTRMRGSQFFSAMTESCKKLKTSNVFSSLIVR